MEFLAFNLKQMELSEGHWPKKKKHEWGEYMENSVTNCIEQIYRNNILDGAWILKWSLAALNLW